MAMNNRAINVFGGVAWLDATADSAKHSDRYHLCRALLMEIVAHKLNMAKEAGVFDVVD